MAEEKETEKKDKSTRRSRNNPKAKEKTKKISSSTKTNKVAEKKNTTKKETKKTDKIVKDQSLDSVKEDIKKEIVKEIKDEKEEAINEVKEVSKEQVEKINDLKDEITEVKKEEPKVEETSVVKVEENNVTPVVSEVTNPQENTPVVNPKIEYENSYPQSFFDGGLLALIGWKLLGFLLSIISLGLLAPLGKIFVLKWQYKHTVINGRRLTFDGNYFELLGKMICWVLLTIITLGIYSFFIPVAWNKWVIKHTHYEGGVIDPNKPSQFTGNTLQYIGIFLLNLVLILFSIGILYPCAYCLSVNWRIKHTVIDGDTMEFDGRSIHLWGLFVKWVFFTIITLGIYSFWIPISLLKWETKHTNKKGLSKKPYNALVAVILPVIVAAFIGGVILTIVLSGTISYNMFSKRAEQSEENETKTGTEWGDKYYRFIRDDSSDYSSVKGAFIDFNNDQVPELVLDKQEKACESCTVTSNDIVVLYIKNDKVKESSSYENASLEQYYNMEEEKTEWFIVEDDESYTSGSSIVTEKEETIVVESEAEIKDFEAKYMDTEAEVNYQDIEKESLTKDMSSLVSDYEDKENYEALSDSEVKEKVEEYQEQQKLLEEAILTQDNYKEKVAETVKWFNGAYLGATYGWRSVFDYKQVYNVKIPGVSQYEMVYEVVGLTSIDSLKEQLSKYVSSDKFNNFNEYIGKELKEYNGKVYWTTGGIGAGTYLKNYELVSSDGGISKVKLNYYDGLSEYFEQAVTLTIEYQPDTMSYLVTDWSN